MRFSELENVRVAILGAGREGQAVWRQIRRRFPAKTLSLFAESDIDAGFLRELDPAIDEYQIGPLDVNSLKQFNVLIRSAGISPYRRELKELRSSGIRFTSASNLWFAENPDARTICISGTKGKSTTAALTAHLLNHAGVKASLAGNIGRPMLDRDNDAVDWWVIELSSYQISDLVAEPDVVLLLNLSDEHVDWHGSAEKYRADKLKLADLVGDGRVIANFMEAVLVEKLGEYPGIIWFNHGDTWKADESGVFAGDERYVSAPASMPGEHNMHNLAAALTVLDELGLQVKDLDQALGSFTGLPHRLQLIGEKAGIRYVNDSISTTPVSVAAALQTFGYKDVVLLLGGMDRGLYWDDFAMDLSDRTPYAVITLPDNGPKIFDCFKRAGVNPEGGLHELSQLSDAVALAQVLVPENGCILLSPGAPSFPHFRDFEDRGNQFKKYAGIEKSTSSAH
jgi:UDP-N-acetylmuramoylalanine--D-glutamate ligase